MPLFGIKEKPQPQTNQEQHTDFKLPSLEDIHTEHAQSKPVPEKHEEETAVQYARPAAAPLFVKLERYNHILNCLNEVKSTLVTLRNMFGALNELKKIEGDTVKSIQGATEKINNKLCALDAEFVRPSGFHDTATYHDSYNVGELESVLSSLKSQVEQLKTELH